MTERPAFLRPMSELIELGAIQYLNANWAIPHGVMFTVYVDDDTGQTALGWSWIEADAEPSMAQEILDHERERSDAFAAWLTKNLAR